MTASARDAAGNEATATQRCYVRDAGMTVSLFEGIDVERSLSHRDLNNVALATGSMDAVRTIVLPEAGLFAFPAEADFVFSYQDRTLLCLPLNGAKFALLQNTSYDSVDADAVPSSAFSSDSSGTAVGSADTLLIETAEGNYAKVGAVQTDAAEWTISFSSELFAP